MEIQLNKIHPAVLITTQHCWLFWFLLLQRKFLLVKSTELFTHFSINKGKFAENFLHDLGQWNKKSQKKTKKKNSEINQKLLRITISHINVLLYTGYPSEKLT